MFAHMAKGIIPPAPGLSSRTNDQVVVPELKFDLIVELALFQECLGDANTARVPNLNESGFHQQASVFVECIQCKYESGWAMSTYSLTVLTLEGGTGR